MTSKILLQGIVLISIVATSLAYRQGIANESNLNHHEAMNNTMNQTNDKGISNSVKVVISQLIAREEVRPPLGIPPQPNRDIGFASVFLSLENHQESNQNVTIQNIEIQNASDHQVKPFDFEPMFIELKPLESSIVDIHLNNKAGYVGEDSIIAIITYKIGDDIYVIESDPIQVDRHSGDSCLSKS